MTLAEYMDQKDLTDDALAKRVGVSRGYITQLRLGMRSNPSIPIAAKIEAETNGRVPMKVWAA